MLPAGYPAKQTPAPLYWNTDTHAILGDQLAAPARFEGKGKGRARSGTSRFRDFEGGWALGWIWRALATSGPSRLCNLHHVAESLLIFVLSELPLELSLKLHDCEGGRHSVVAGVPPLSVQICRRSFFSEAENRSRAESGRRRSQSQSSFQLVDSAPNLVRSKCGASARCALRTERDRNSDASRRSESRIFLISCCGSLASVADWPAAVLGHVNYDKTIISFPPSEGPHWEEKGRDQTHERRYRQRLWLIR